MPDATAAIDYLAAPGAHPPKPVVVVFGDDALLKRHVLAGLRKAVLGDEADFAPAAWPGPSALLRDVLHELNTVAMFGPRRLVVVDEADPFVTNHRAELEDYVARPAMTGVLVLSVGPWPSNTRLYKAVAAAGLQVDCRSPAAAAVPRWLGRWARQAHAVELAAGAAEMLLELVGPELGLLDQELAKLALSAGPSGKVTPEIVERLAGGWRTRTAWEMLDAALAGNAREAVVQLDRLMLAGEHPVAILAQIAGSLRRLAAATRLVRNAEAAGRRLSVRGALEQVGVKSFVLEKTERQLRRLGRKRASELYRWLLDADLDLKGDSPLPPRLILDRLILRLASPAA
jgi:DNA polymerase-3 subunit delta